MDTRKVVAELIGTFMFLTTGYLSVAAFRATDPATPGLLVVPFAFGLGLLGALFAFARISGGHFNPAVTLAMILDKRTPPAEGVGYIVAQIVGAIGAAVLVMVAVSQADVAAGETMPGPNISDVGAFIIEVAMTMVFVLVILVVTKRAANHALLAIPLTLISIHFAIASLTGSSVNPARSIGSAVVGGGDGLNSLWIYLTAPFIGAIIAWGIWQLTDGDREPAAG